MKEIPMWTYSGENTMNLTDTERKILEEISSANPKTAMPYIVNNTEAYKKLYREGLIIEDSSESNLGIVLTERGRRCLRSPNH